MYAEDLAKSNSKLESANRDLKRLDDAKSEFLSIASHQLRTPLTAIKGLSSMLLEGDYGHIDTKPREVVNNIFRACPKSLFRCENFKIRAKIMKNEEAYYTICRRVLSYLQPNFGICSRKWTFRTGSKQRENE